MSSSPVGTGQSAFQPKLSAAEAVSNIQLYVNRLKELNNNEKDDLLRNCLPLIDLFQNDITKLEFQGIKRENFYGFLKRFESECPDVWSKLPEPLRKGLQIQNVGSAALSSSTTTHSASESQREIKTKVASANELEQKETKEAAAIREQEELLVLYGRIDQVATFFSNKVQVKVEASQPDRNNKVTYSIVNTYAFTLYKYLEDAVNYIKVNPGKQNMPLKEFALQLLQDGIPSGFPKLNQSGFSDALSENQTRMEELLKAVLSVKEIVLKNPNFQNLSIYFEQLEKEINENDINQIKVNEDALLTICTFPSIERGIETLLIEAQKLIPSQRKGKELRKTLLDDYLACRRLAQFRIDKLSEKDIFPLKKIELQKCFVLLESSTIKEKLENKPELMGIPTKEGEKFSVSGLLEELKKSYPTIFSDGLKSDPNISYPHCLEFEPSFRDYLTSVLGNIEAEKKELEAKRAKEEAEQKALEAKVEAERKAGEEGPKKQLERDGLAKTAFISASRNPPIPPLQDKEWLIVYNTTRQKYFIRQKDADTRIDNLSSVIKDDQFLPKFFEDFGLLQLRLDHLLISSRPIDEQREERRQVEVKIRTLAEAEIQIKKREALLRNLKTIGIYNVCHLSDELPKLEGNQWLIYYNIDDKRYYRKDIYGDLRILDIFEAADDNKFFAYFPDLEKRKHLRILPKGR